MLCANCLDVWNWVKLEAETFFVGGRRRVSGLRVVGLVLNV